MRKQLLYLSLSLLFLGLMFFLNFLLNLYGGTTLNFFYHDLKEIRRKHQDKAKKLAFIAKNDLAFFVSTSCMQVVLSIFYGEFVARFFFGEGKTPFHWLFLITILTALVTDILSYQLASKSRKKRVFLNNFFINVAYCWVKLSSFFWRVTPRRKIIGTSEKEMMVYVKNLAEDKVLEEKEVELVQAALSFDDLMIKEIMIPVEKVIFFRKDMNFIEIVDIHLNHFFSVYPVLDEKKQVCGVFNFRKLYHNCDFDQFQNVKWQEEIEVKFLSFSPNQSLGELLDFLRNDEITIGIVNSNGNFIGIVTRTDILNALLGKRKNKPSRVRLLETSGD